LLQHKLKGDYSLKWLRGQYLDAAKLEIENMQIENKNLTHQLNILKEDLKQSDREKNAKNQSYQTEIQNLNLQINKFEIINDKFKHEILDREAKLKSTVEESKTMYEEISLYKQQSNSKIVELDE